MRIKSIVYMAALLFVLFPASALANLCVRNDSGQQLNMGLACGFSAAFPPDWIPDTLVGRGQSICRDNRILFVPTPCIMMARGLLHGKPRGCISAPILASQRVTARLFSGAISLNPLDTARCFFD